MATAMARRATFVHQVLAHQREIFGCFANVDSETRQVESVELLFEISALCVLVDAFVVAGQCAVDTVAFTFCEREGGR